MDHVLEAGARSLILVSTATLFTISGCRTIAGMAFVKTAPDSSIMFSWVFQMVPLRRLVVMGINKMTGSGLERLGGLRRGGHIWYRSWRK